MAADRDLGRPLQRRDPIKIVPYDGSWAVSFEQQRTRVEAALRSHLIGSVEHIGSTAVPGLPAKPIIDMLARVADFDATASIVADLEEIDWVHAPEPGDKELRKWSFCFPSSEWRTHHLHILEHRSPNWRHLLLFRDHLRASPEVAAEYGRIKAELAMADDQDRPRYRSGKAPFIANVLRQLVEPADDRS